MIEKILEANNKSLKYQGLIITLLIANIKMTMMVMRALYKKETVSRWTEFVNGLEAKVDEEMKDE